MFDLKSPSMTSALFSPLHHQLDRLSIMISLHFNTTNQTTKTVTTKVAEIIFGKRRYDFPNVRITVGQDLQAVLPTATRGQLSSHVIDLCPPNSNNIKTTNN